MEKVIYELRPYLFIIAGLSAILASHSDRLMLVSGFLLIAASGHIVRNRMKHRAWLATP